MKDMSKIDSQLKSYLHQQWILCNHTKYGHYFYEWLENITDNQINYFTKQMLKAKHE